MTETQTSPPTHTLLIKILVIIGFAVTIVVIVWLSIQGIKRLPTAFSSLASIAENIQTYQPSADTETPAKETPETTEIPSQEEMITTTSTEEKTTQETHASLPQGKSTTTTTTAPDVPTTSRVPTSVPLTSKTHPVLTTQLVYPQSNQNGYVDLNVATLGSGTLRNGVFVRTPQYESGFRNAIQFNIKNIGTKTSGTWIVKTILPSGGLYESNLQLPLKPQEHVTFTLEFNLEKTRKDFVEIRNTVYTENDANRKNDTSVWTVAVRD